MAPSAIFGRASATLGTALFVTVVAYLHLVQDNYDPARQMMSELVFGEGGDLMVLAFLGLGAAILGSGLCIGPRASIPASATLMIAAVTTVAAGFLRLGDATTLHVLLVAVTFVLMTLTMLLLPRLIRLARPSAVMSPTCGTLATIAIALGYGPLPIGYAQRLGVIVIITWIVWVAWTDVRNVSPPA